MLRDKQGNAYTDILELHTIELTKNTDKEQPNPLDEWHSLFNAETEDDLDMIKSKTRNKGIMEAIKELKEISLRDRFRYEYEMRLKAKRDREAEDEFVLEQGKKIGREYEREKSIKILITTLRGHGLTDEQIVSDLMEKYELSKEEAEEKIR